MALSCSCGEWEGEPGTWFFEHLDDLKPLATSKRRRCTSCGELIDVGSECLEFERYRGPNDEVEDRIHGEGAIIQIGSWYMCARCGEKYLNLSALGYCLGCKRNMDEAMAEYHKLTGWKPGMGPGSNREKK